MTSAVSNETRTVNAEHRTHIVQALWPVGGDSRMSVWAILDGARDPAIHALLMASRLEYRCLYSGSLPRSLEMAAPQLVELLPGHQLTERLLSDGWGRSWGVFLRLDDPANLRHHLRKFLRVRHADGRSLLFRFYDPRVLRVYLPTCDATELIQFFGPIAHFFAEADDGKGLLEFVQQRGRLVLHRHDF